MTHIFQKLATFCRLSTLIFVVTLPLEASRLPPSAPPPLPRWAHPFLPAGEIAGGEKVKEPPHYVYLPIL